MKRFWIIVAVAIILSGIGYLIFGKLEKNLVYFVTPTELLARGDTAFNQSVRLGGMVQKGTVQWDSERTQLQFQLTDGTKTILVMSDQTPPQMFQEEMGVVVEGKLSKGVGRLSGGVYFVADRLMVKHSNEYHPPKSGEKPAIIYKDIIK